MTATLVIGGSGGLGSAIARAFAERGDDVTVTSRDKAGAEAAAAEIGSGAREAARGADREAVAGTVQGLALDLARPQTIAASLADITEVDHLVVTAVGQAANTLADFDVTAAVAAVTMKLVGYAEAVRVLRGRFTPRASVVLFGGLAKDRPYPGSTVVTTFNAGISGLVRTLALEIAPHRVNALHPGLVGDSPRWRDVPEPPHATRTPTGHLPTVADIVDATDFLLRNSGVNAHDLNVEGGLLVT